MYLTTIREPMLAAPMKPEKGETMDKLKFPLLASPKLDGIRCVVVNGIALSRTLKPIANRYVQKMVGDHALDGFDGELMVGDGSNFQAVTSGIMSADGRPDFTFNVFDLWNLDPTYDRKAFQYKFRRELYADKVMCSRAVGKDFLKAVKVVTINSLEELEKYTDKCVTGGFEGAMVRLPEGPYKQGRATFREGYLTKIKPMEDREGVWTGIEEGETNNNPATIDERGKTKRSSHKANKVKNGTLGKIILWDTEFGEIKLGTGWDDAFSREVMANPKKYMGQPVKYRFQRAGMKDKPRIPSFLGVRSKDDM